MWIIVNLTRKILTWLLQDLVKAKALGCVYWWYHRISYSAGLKLSCRSVFLGLYTEPPWAPRNKEMELWKCPAEYVLFTPATKRNGVPEARKCGKNYVHDYLIEGCVITPKVNNTSGCKVKITFERVTWTLAVSNFWFLKCFFSRKFICV